LKWIPADLRKYLAQQEVAEWSQGGWKIHMFISYLKYKNTLISVQWWSFEGRDVFITIMSQQKLCTNSKRTYWWIH
jgi:hypothetical protein